MKREHKKSDKLAMELARLQMAFEENGDETWEQIKGTFKNPKKLLVMLGAALLLTLLIVVGVFLGSIHAPDIPGFEGTPGEEWDESDLKQPINQSGRKEGYYTFLLLGADNDGSNTDTIMVVSYDVPNQDLSIMSIPRDTMVNVRWDIKKINSVYSVYGVDGLMDHIEKLLGFAPDFYVKIDVHAFVEVIDLLGGVYFDVPRNMDYDDPYQNLHIHLKKGYQHLDGTESMGLVRWRHNNEFTLGYSDEERMKTQQAFLRAAAEQCISLKNWNKISGLIDLFYTYVESDLELGEMLWFAKQAMGLDLATDITTCTMPGNYEAYAWSRTYQNYQSYVTVNASEMIETVNVHFNPYQGSMRLSDLDIMSIRSDGSVSSSTGYTADSKAALPPELPEKEEPVEGEEPLEGEATPGSLEVLPEAETETEETADDGR